mmetsp:Transcript_3623/g.7650  ORF Transcript_3623/g.7650 Transcript_3623/m.7650 type:complete len:274 (-) Transcript_3623:206-1027(-)
MVVVASTAYTGWKAPEPTLGRNMVKKCCASMDSVVVFDVGANNGAWSAALLQACSAAANVSPSNSSAKQRHETRRGRSGREIVIVEPQPKFTSRLQELAEKAAGMTPAWGATFLPAAASDSAGNSTFWVSSVAGGISSSLTERNAVVTRKHPTLTPITVPVVNLASEIFSRVHTGSFAYRGKQAGRRARMMLKLDIEAFEFNLLPNLLATRALCVLDALLVEWHVRAAANASAAHAFRLRFDSALERACADAEFAVERIVVEHEDKYSYRIPG